MVAMVLCLAAVYGINVNVTISSYTIFLTDQSGLSIHSLELAQRAHQHDLFLIELDQSGWHLVN